MNRFSLAACTVHWAAQLIIQQIRTIWLYDFFRGRLVAMWPIIFHVQALNDLAKVNVLSDVIPYGHTAVLMLYPI